MEPSWGVGLRMGGGHGEDRGKWWENRDNCIGTSIKKGKKKILGDLP